MAWDCGNQTEAGDLTIGGVPMNCAAWRVENLYELWLPATQRGTDRDRVRPGVNGRLPRRRRVDVTTRSLQMTVIGGFNHLGVAHPSMFIGMQANVDYLVANVVNPPNTVTGTRSATLTMPDGTTRTKDIHVQGMEFGSMHRQAREATLTIEISIPEGRF